jgi:hypothetical protein
MFATYQLLGTDSECNDERNDLYASEIDTYDIKFWIVSFSTKLLGCLPALTLVVL